MEETEGVDGRSLGRCRRGGDTQDEVRRRWCGTMQDRKSDREQIGGGHRAVGGGSLLPRMSGESWASHEGVAGRCAEAGSRAMKTLT